MLDKIINQLTDNDPALTELDLASVSSSAQEMGVFLSRLPKALANNQHLIKLCLRNEYCNLTVYRNLREILEVLKTNTHVTTLDLSDNDMMMRLEDAEAIAQMLEVNNSLLTLDLYYDGIGDGGIEVIMGAIKRNPPLKELNLGFNDIGVKGAQAIAGMLAENPPLTSLNLAHNHIGYEGLKAIAEAMEKNTNLLKLDGIDVSIGIEEPSPDIENDFATCFQTIEKCLKRNKLENIISRLESNDPDLTSLNLRGDQEIDIKTLKRIAEALRRNSHLKKLDLDSCQISDEGVQIISQALEENRSVENLYLGSNGIGQKGGEALARMLKVNTCLTVLSLGTNNINPKGAKAIAEAISENSSLIQLVISNNKIGDEGAEAIALAIEKNTNLTHLYLAFNRIQHETGEAALTRSLEKNKHLTVLNLAFDPTCKHCKKRFEYLERNENLLKGKNQSVTSQSEIPQVSSLPDTLPTVAAESLLQISQTKTLENQSIANQLPHKKFPENVLLELTNTDTLVEKKKNKSAGFSWGKLALFLCVVGALGVGGLAIAGLFFSLWTIIPAAVLLIGTGVSIKAIYDEYQQRQSARQTKLTSPDDDGNKLMILDENALQQQLNTPINAQVIKLNPSHISTRYPGSVDERIAAGEKYLDQSKEAEQAEQIIIQKVNEFVSALKQNLIIKCQDTTLEFTPEEVRECFKDMGDQLGMSKTCLGDYSFFWNFNIDDKLHKPVRKPGQKLFSDTSHLLCISTPDLLGKDDLVYRSELLLKKSVINHCLGKDIAIVNPNRTTNNSLVIRSSSIERIVREHSQQKNSPIL